MKVLGVANQKGGVGKTATTVHLALDAVERGMRVVIIDLDPQANASDSLQEYECAVPASDLFKPGVNLPVLLSAEEGEGQRLALVPGDELLANLEKKEFADVGNSLKASIEALGAQGYDLCLIDTPPTIGNALASALYVADYVLCPIEPERFSIKGIKKMQAVISNIRRFNPQLQFIGMVPTMVDGRVERHAENVAALRATYKQLVTPMTIGLRTSVADAMAEGIPVWKIKKTAARVAAKEVRALAQYVFEKMEIA